MLDVGVELSHNRKRREKMSNESSQIVGYRVKRGTNILSVKVPPEMEIRLLTGIGFMDDLLGASDKEQGIVPSAVYLFSGTPGAGKTTLAQQIADSWTGIHGKDTCLYSGGEEHVFQMRKLTKRLGLRNGFVVGDDRLVPNAIAHARELRGDKPKSPFLFVFDSIQTHDDGYYKDGATNSKTPVRILKQINEYCKETFANAILIGQVTKAGKFAGKEELKHMSDGHLHLKIDQRPTSTTFGQRILECEKNRFGVSQRGYYLGLDEKKGLYEAGEWSPDVDNE